jgi:hypothetical protein
MNGKGFEGSDREVLVRYYSGIRLEGRRKTTKPLIRIAGRRGGESNPGPLEVEKYKRLHRKPGT